MESLLGWMVRPARMWRMYRMIPARTPTTLDAVHAVG